MTSPPVEISRILGRQAYRCLGCFYDRFQSHWLYSKEYFLNMNEAINRTSIGKINVNEGGDTGHLQSFFRADAISCDRFWPSVIKGYKHDSLNDWKSTSPYCWLLWSSSKRLVSYASPHPPPFSDHLCGLLLQHKHLQRKISVLPVINICTLMVE